jgi:hypothetical protein
MERFVNGILRWDGEFFRLLLWRFGCAYIASPPGTRDRMADEDFFLFSFSISRRNEIPKNANLISLLDFLYQVFSF